MYIINGEQQMLIFFFFFLMYGDCVYNNVRILWTIVLLWQFQISREFFPWLNEVKL